MAEFCIHEKHGGICEKTYGFCNLGDCPYEDLKEYATVRHGRWEEAIEPLGWNKVIVASCSVCGDSWVLDEFTIDEYAKWHQYCSSCGAKMDGYITMPDAEDEDDGE